MDAGYVYVLINPSMPGLVKIGSTLRESQMRASRLRTTGVPTPFEVAFEVFTDDFREIERQVHVELAPFRISQDREFFRYPLKDAIKLLLRLQKQTREPEATFSALSIFQRLKEKYSARWFDADIADVRLIQTDERVWVEISRVSKNPHGLEDQLIRRTDLGFVVHNDERPMFDVQSSVVENGRRFTEDLTPWSIHQICDLFNDAGDREMPKS